MSNKSQVVVINWTQANGEQKVRHVQTREHKTKQDDKTKMKERKKKETQKI